MKFKAGDTVRLLRSFETLSRKPHLIGKLGKVIKTSSAVIGLYHAVSVEFEVEEEVIDCVKKLTHHDFYPESELELVNGLDRVLEEL